MNQDRLEVVKQEMARVKVRILGVSELKWTGLTKFNSDDYNIHHWGQESLRGDGVAITVNKSPKYSTWVQPPKRQNDLSFCPRQTTQHHSNPSLVPATDAKEAEVEWFYEDLQHLLTNAKKRYPFHHGGLKCKIRKSTGKVGLGVQNKAAQRLAEFCQANTLVIANTLFQHCKRWLHMNITK